MEQKVYCNNCDTGRTGKVIHTRCKCCGKMFETLHRPPDTVCKECSDKMLHDGVFRCRACGEDIDSARPAGESAPEAKDMSRAYRREMKKEKCKKKYSMNSYAANGKKGRNGKYMVDSDIDKEERTMKMKSRKNDRHSDNQSIKRGLREGFSDYDLDDLAGGKEKFKNRNTRKYF